MYFLTRRVANSAALFVGSSIATDNFRPIPAEEIRQYLLGGFPEPVARLWLSYLLRPWAAC